MPKDDDLIKEKIDDEIDLLNFDLDDLTEEDGGLDLSEKGPAQEDSDDEIIDLLDIIEKGDELGDTEGDDIAQLLGSDDTIVESDKPTDLESVSVEEKVPDVRKSIEPTEVDLDISSLEMESELSVEDVSESAAETGEIDVSESDLEKMLQDESGLELGDELESPLNTDETFEDLMKDADLEESFSVETTDLKVEMGEEDITESDLEKLLGDQSAEELVEAVEPPAEPEVPRPIVKEPTIKMEAGAPEEVSMEESVSPGIEPEEPVKTPPVQPVEEAVQISAERIETIVTNVVEKVTRETITEVVERVVKETVTDIIERIVSETMDNVIERTVRETVTDVVEKSARETISDVTEKVTHEVMSDVAEKIARDTMVDVAEKVITEAIEALKRSLESVTD